MPPPTHIAYQALLALHMNGTGTALKQHIIFNWHSMFKLEASWTNEKEGWRK